MRRRALLALLLSVGAVPAAAAPTRDAFLCYGARAASGAPRFPGAADLAIADRFGAGRLAVRRPRHLCAPTSVSGGAPLDPATHLTSHLSVPDRGTERVAVVGLRVANQLGETVVDLVPADLTLIPSAVDAETSPPAPVPGTHRVDTFHCYGIAAAPGFARGAHIVVDDALGGTRSLEVVRPRVLCTPAELAGQAIVESTAALACYVVRPAGRVSRHRRTRLHVTNGFGGATLDAGAEALLCLPSRASTGACNGSAALCGRRFDAVAYPTTHNAMSNEDEAWDFPNQTHGLSRQLADGVRALMLDTHYYQGIAQLCHELCGLGHEPLVDGLVKIRRFLDLHPEEVVTIIFEAYVSAEDTAAAFAASGLLPYVHVQPLGVPWPALDDMIATGQRLVVFSDERGSPAWYHYVWDYAWETPFSFENPEDFVCTPNRGTAPNSLFILNHFLTRVVGSRELAELVNHDPLLTDRALDCMAEGAQLPNFVTVDFYDVGDLFAVVRTLNGL